MIFEIFGTFGRTIDIVCKLFHLRWYERRARIISATHHESTRFDRSQLISHVDSHTATVDNTYSSYL